MSSEAPRTAEDELPIEMSVDSVMTRSEQYRLFFERNVRAPVYILWEDIRTRLGSLMLFIYILMGTVGVMLIEYPQLNEGDRYVQPFTTLAFPLGTTGQGRDLLALIVHATPDMFKMIFAGAIFAMSMATIVGTLSGLEGGATDRVLMYITDVMMTIPGLPLVIVLAAFLQPENPYVVGLILTINAWAGFARAIRSEVLKLRDASYVEASRAMGISTPSILLKDVIPNLMPYILVNFANMARRVIYASVALYYLGVLPITSLNWGIIMNQAGTSALIRPIAIHWLWIPMATIVGISFGLILMAQGADRLFNPRVRARHMSAEADELAEDTVGRDTTTIEQV